jgi:hypothetical protein
MGKPRQQASPGAGSSPGSGSGPDRRSTGAPGRGADLLSLGNFVVLGLPDGMLGTAWPSMRVTFGAPVGDLGLILLLATAGSVLVTALVGRLIRRLGVAALLTVAGVTAAAGYAGFAVAPGLWLVLATAVLTGAAAGMMDAGLNTAVALTGRQRLLNLLHVALDLVVVGFWLRQRRRYGPPPAPDETADASAPDPAAGWSRRRYRAVVAAGMGVFFVYTGLEVGAGQWEASFCRGHLDLSAGVTGLATFGYWGALTAVRIGLALAPRPVAPQAVVRWGSAIGVLGAAAIWWQPGTVVTVIGFVVLGGALAGVFPALISLTPVRLGERSARHVIAWQIGAAAAGGAALSALIGLLIGATSLAILGPAVTVLAVILVLTVLALTRLAPIAPAR